MERTFKSKSDLRETLSEIKNKTAFLADPNMSMCEKNDGCSPEVMYGMILIFDQIINQIEEVDKALYENIYEVVETKTEKVFNNRKKKNIQSAKMPQA